MAELDRHYKIASACNVYNWGGGGKGEEVEMEGEGSLCHTSCPWGLSGHVGLAEGERKHRGGSGACGCVEGGQLRVPRLHHRTVFPFTSEQSRHSGCFTFLLFFLTYFDQSLLSWHPQRDILTSENSFSIFRLWPTKVGFSFLPSDREVCHLKWLVLKVCTWGLDNQVNDGKLRCVNVIVLKHVQMCRCYQANLCLAADRNSELWGSEFASKLGQARRRLRTTLFTGAENIFVAFSCA